MPGFKLVAEGLRFPDAPVLLEDGSLAVAETGRGTITCIDQAGRMSIIADLGGGPAGMALGPDGCLYVCNHGGVAFEEVGGRARPVGLAQDEGGGRIERVDPLTGKSDLLYDRCGDRRLAGPKDLVFDRFGGFYFTDRGGDRSRARDLGSVYYGRIDGSHLAEVIHPVALPSGIGLSPDESTLYVAEAETARIWAFDLSGPGRISHQPFPSPQGGRFLYNQQGFQLYAGMALEVSGAICVATQMLGALSIVSSEGEVIDQIYLPDLFISNLCFGGRDRTLAYVTLGGFGQLVTMPWRRPGLKLNFGP